MSRLYKRRKKVDNEVERNLITGFIVSAEVLRQLQSIYRPKFMKLKFAHIVIKWCFDYFKRYEKAPAKHIEDIFQAHVRADLDEEQEELIGSFLSSISREFQRADKFNADYLVDEAQHYFKERSLEQLKDDIDVQLLDGNVEEADKVVAEYVHVERMQDTSTNPFGDEALIRDAFQQVENPLFTVPGALGWLLNDQLVREGFIGFMGPEKSGKTFTMMDLAKRAARARNNVAFFGVGDMSKKQYTARWHVSLAGKSNLERYCGRMLVPCLDCVHNQLDDCSRKARTSPCGLPDMDEEDDLRENLSRKFFKKASKKYKPCSVCKRERHFKGSVWYTTRQPVEPLTWREGVKHGRRFMKRLQGRDFKLETYPGDANVKKIKAQILLWEEYEGFIPDVIFIDYADLLQPENSYQQDVRHQQNETWRALRAMSLDRHCLVVTATQTDTASYDAHVLKRKHFSEDKRKYSHVTAMVGLNATPKDDALGIMRQNMVILREGDFDPNDCINVIQCLQIGKPIIQSYF